MSKKMIEITADNIAQTLQTALAPTRLEVIDESYQHAGHVGANETGAGTHFRIKIATPAFTVNGKKISLVMQHRLVYDALRLYIDQGLHALAIETNF
jgi:BolA family transcriptional regulator, general stress-responsive regulator